jgi:hypothetical protein
MGKFDELYKRIINEELDVNTSKVDYEIVRIDDYEQAKEYFTKHPEFHAGTNLLDKTMFDAYNPPFFILTRNTQPEYIYHIGLNKIFDKNNKEQKLEDFKDVIEKIKSSNL